MLPYHSPAKKTMLRVKFKPRRPQRQGSGCSCPWPCTAQQKPTLSLDLATERAHMGQPHGPASQGTAQPGVRVHKSTGLQAAHESCSLAGSLMKLISLLQPFLFPIKAQALAGFSSQESFPMPDAKSRCMQARKVRQRCKAGLARPQQLSRHLQATPACHQPWPGAHMHDVPERARTVSWALLLWVST